MSSRYSFEEFAAARGGDGHAVSLKMQVQGVCFCRNHSRKAWKIIDDHRAKSPSLDGEFVEHESGPEILIWVAAGTAVVTLAKSVIDLVTTVVKACVEPRTHRPCSVDVIVKTIEKDGRCREKRVLRFSPDDVVHRSLIEQALNNAFTKQLAPSNPPSVAKRKAKKMPKPERRQ